MAFHTIVAAVDFSEASHDALRVATDTARESSGQLHLVHVVPMPVYEAWSVNAPDVEAAGLQGQWLADARQQIQALAASVPLDLSRLSCAALSGQAAPEIVRYASEHRADLIVLGTHGHGWMGRLVLGSVAERVLHHAPCPVLVVPHDRTGQQEAPGEGRLTA